MQFQESRPIYMQIADKIMDDITGGVYPAEGRLPSVREYAASVMVNANTVMRSYDYLASQELIFNRRGIGFFVAPGAPDRIAAMRRKEFFAADAPRFFSRLASFDTTPEELARLYADYLSAINK